MDRIKLNREEKKVREELINYSSRKSTITYQKLSNLTGLELDMQDPSHRNRIAEILGNISAFEFSNERPLLSSVVLNTNNYEGDGYFKLCEELGFGNWESLKRDKKFAKTRINECYEFWSDKDNIDSFKKID